MNGPRSTAPDGAEDLRGRFEELAPVILVDPAPVVRRGRRRRTAVRLGSGVGAVALVLAAVLLIRPGAAPSPVTAPPTPEAPGPVALQVVPEVLAPGGVVTAVLVAVEPNEATFGIAAEVDRWDGQEWDRVGETALCLVEWQCVATVTDRLDAVEDIGLGATPGTLGPATSLSTEGLADGWYRLVQRAAGEEPAATGVFEVRTGAPAAPPQPASDEVRLSVDPVLVPLDGGLASVRTHVPPGDDGTLTSEDIAAVDGDLEPTALVQRWDGTGWRDVVDLPVGERAADVGVEWGSPVGLPALEAGSYRLLRMRSVADPIWGVFTVTAAAPSLPRTTPAAGAGTDAEPGTTPSDAFAPDSPACVENAGRCLLGAWWRDVVAEAGAATGGGDHDYGVLLTDSVWVDDQRSLWLALFPAEAAPESTAELVVETTTQVGDVQVEAGRWAAPGQWDDGAEGRRLTCGGFVLTMSSTDLRPEEIDPLVESIATAMAGCPADLADLASRYPDYPPVP